MGKLTKAQILAIPHKLKNRSRSELADEYKVNPETISRWVKTLRSRGHKIPLRRGPKPILDDKNN